jgi:hypothetical protein
MEDTKSIAGASIDGTPRPLRVGDIVVRYSRHIGEWVAAQITGPGPDWAKKTVGVLELDWSGPEPADVSDLAQAAPLRLTHHSWAGRLSYSNYDWTLPKSYRVLGNLPLLHSELSPGYSGHCWRVGEQLARQRSWDRGKWDYVERNKIECSETELRALLAAESRPDVLDLHVSAVKDLDCRTLVAHFPNLVELKLWGDLGDLRQASHLNELASLEVLYLSDLFGMTGDDLLSPDRVPRLETLALDSIPAEYAASTRKAWRKERTRGVLVAVTSARAEGWVLENRDNPLREWGDREHITSSEYKKSVKQYKTTRDSVKAACTAGEATAALQAIGAQFGEAFNEIDRRHGFIETEEREELFAVLEELAVQHSADVEAARVALWSGADSSRDW